MEKSDNNYDDQEQRNELVTGSNMPKKKYSLSQEEIFFNAPELEVGSEYREEEGVLKEIPGLPISKTSELCKRGNGKDVKYIVPKMDITYSLSDEEVKRK